MYVRGGISFRYVLRESRGLLAGAFVLASIVYLVLDTFGFEALELPALPVATIGLVVSLYLGFQSSAAYSRWWEARGIWGDIVNSSRIWAQYCLTFPDTPEESTGEASHALIRRHLAWLNALRFQLRRTSKLRLGRSPGLFGRRRGAGIASATTPERYRSFLSEAEVETVAGMANPAAHILRLQGDALRRLREDGCIDSYRFVEMSRVLARLYDAQGGSERIKNTPFPRQFIYLGRIFTWLLIFLTPFAFVDAFVRLADTQSYAAVLVDDYAYVLVPFSVLVSWMFFLIERVSESCEDPFEGGTTDVPISTLTRVIEIDLLQMLGDAEVPEPYQPSGGVLY